MDMTADDIGRVTFKRQHKMNSSVKKTYLEKNPSLLQLHITQTVFRKAQWIQQNVSFNSFIFLREWDDMGGGFGSY